MKSVEMECCVRSYVIEQSYSGERQGLTHDSGVEILEWTSQKARFLNLC